jgi:hypothetical protein
LLGQPCTHQASTKAVSACHSRSPLPWRACRLKIAAWGRGGLTASSSSPSWPFSKTAITVRPPRTPREQRTPPCLENVPPGMHARGRGMPHTCTWPCAQPHRASWKRAANKHKVGKADGNVLQLQHLALRVFWPRTRARQRAAPDPVPGRHLAITVSHRNGQRTCNASDCQEFEATL